MLTDEERAEMDAQLRNVLARHNVTGPDGEALLVSLRVLMNAWTITAGVFSYGRGQRSVLAPRH